jgi:sterol 24-C-methyltransferase
MNDSRDQVERIRAYYDKTESRWGYRVLLGGRKHFGYYPLGQPKLSYAAAQQRMEDELGRRLELPPGSLVADAGCGEGGVALRLANKFGLRVTGVDVLTDNVERAKRAAVESGLAKELRFQVADYTQLPFGSASFNGLYTMETLVHADDHVAALAEFRRVLKPGGRLVLFEYTMPRREDMDARKAAAFDEICDTSAMPSFRRFINGTLPDIVSAAEFEIVHTADVSTAVEPMLRSFAFWGTLPYWLARQLRRKHKVVNAMAGVELYRYRSSWHYVVVVADKPTA